MVVGEIAEPCELLVVGGGPGGYVAACRAARLGREVVLVERAGAAGLGGCCLHVGCIPSKALIELAGARHRLDALAEIGLATGEARLDLGTFRAATEASIGRLAGGVGGLLRGAGVRVVEGTARFNRPDQAAVELASGEMLYLQFEQTILATGSRPIELPGLELDGERVLDSSGALALTELPESVAVVGAGYIGIELGTALAKLGSRVAVVEAGDRILPGFDAELTKPVAARLGELGVAVHLGATARSLDAAELVVESAAGELRLEAERVVVAVGRAPATAELGLDALGVPVRPDGLIEVDERQLVDDRIAAIGDLVPGPALEHKATHQGLVAAEALSGLASAFDPIGVPLVAFTDPEIASVGLDPAAAEAAGLDAQVRVFPLSALGRMATIGERRGFARLVCDRAGDRLVGAQIVGPHASELIAEATLAIEMQASPTDLAATVHPHPTLSEALGEAALALVGTPLHVPA